ncbi:zinc ribbon domain-containing protein [Candidatus Woesearchaeota archaeon]|nr:zinc ribbon domain-containing protein [Candidatus Woesearchaeota archaeon]
MDPLDPLRRRAYDANERIAAQLRSNQMPSQREIKNLIAILAELKLKETIKLAEVMRKYVRGGDFEQALPVSPVIRNNIIHGEERSLLHILMPFLASKKKVPILMYSCRQCGEPLSRNSKVCPRCKAPLTV